MLIELIRLIGFFFVWTWFIWPFLFVESLITGIAKAVKGEERFKESLLASISLLIIIAGIIAVNMG